MTDPIRRRTLAALGGLALASRASAQTPPFPSKPIKVVLPFPAGGQTDSLTRLIGQKVEGALGQPLVVENRPGANGLIGTMAVVQAPADGHTLLFHMTAVVTNPILLQGVTYDAFRDLAPVLRTYELNAILAVPADAPPRNLAEYIAWSRASKVPLTYGTTGHASSSHYFMEILARHAGLTLNHVPYKGEAPLLPDLISGRVQGGVISGMSVRQYGDKLRPLAISGTRRMAALPDLPTFAEQGVPDVGNESFAGFLAPAATPPAVIEKLNRELGKALQLPEVRERIQSYALEPVAPASPAEFLAVMRRAHDEWVANARKGLIKPD